MRMRVSAAKSGHERGQGRRKKGGSSRSGASLDTRADLFRRNSSDDPLNLSCALRALGDFRVYTESAGIQTNSCRLHEGARGA